MVLYINACVRNESRTDRIARALLGKITDKYDEIKLSEIHLQPLSEEELNKRTAYIEKGEYINPMFAPAKQRGFIMSLQPEDRMFRTSAMIISKILQMNALE